MELYISIIGLIILIVALTNYFSFSISSFVNRTREITLRQCLGGKSNNIFGLLFIEQFIILTFSCILTLAGMSPGAMSNDVSPSAIQIY